MTEGALFHSHVSFRIFSDSFWDVGKICSFFVNAILPLEANMPHMEWRVVSQRVCMRYSSFTGGAVGCSESCMLECGQWTRRTKAFLLKVVSKLVL